MRKNREKRVISVCPRALTSIKKSQQRDWKQLTLHLHQADSKRLLVHSGGVGQHGQSVKAFSNVEARPLVGKSQSFHCVRDSVRGEKMATKQHSLGVRGISQRTSHLFWLLQLVPLYVLNRHTLTDIYHGSKAGQAETVLSRMEPRRHIHLLGSNHLGARQTRVMDLQTSSYLMSVL